MMFLKSFLSVLLAFVTFTSAAQITFKAKVSKEKLGVNERLRIDFEMNKDGDNFKPPSFEGFEIIGGPSLSVGTFYRNGEKSFSKKYSYYLSPKKQGYININQATVEIDGETYKTSPVRIYVTAAVENPNAPPSANEVASDKIHLVAELSKTDPYLNEAITVVYKLYVSLDIGVSDWSETSMPKFSDFWSQNLDTRSQIKTGVYKGEKYRYVELRKIVLYPQKTGKLTLEPMALSVIVEVPTVRRNIFGQVQAITKVERSITAGDRTINVKALPQNGKPDNFNGAVGDFSLKVTTSKATLNATESLQAKVEVSGTGNLKLFKLPELEVSSSLEVFEPEHTENIQTNLDGMQGSISDTYTIVPQYKGKYVIPPVSFSYFDLSSETYKTVTSDELLIDVLKGPTLASNTVTPNSTTKQNVVQQGEQFNFIKTTSSFTSINTKPFFKTPTFWVLLLTPFLAIPVVMIVTRKQAERAADVVGNKRRRANRLARKYLSEAKKELKNKDAFYVALEKALHNYLKAKLGIETSEFTKEHIQELLTNKAVNEQTITDFRDLLANSELARYTPFNKVAMKQDYDKASVTISTLDKQLN